eukprot:scaffold15881_cov90-Isochrysis_galbana.AAC.2
MAPPRNHECPAFGSFELSLKWCGGTSRLGARGRINNVKWPPGVNTTYSNAHAAPLRNLLASINQTDLYRLANGDQPGGYSRRANTIHTRIDRIYSQLYNSPWQNSCVGFARDAHLSEGSA